MTPRMLALEVAPGRAAGEVLPSDPMTLAQRLWPKVVVAASGCWNFVGASAGSGYGLTGYAGRKIYAHRAAWLLSHFVIPDGLSVLHRCDNRRCVNPEHLFLGTLRDNAHDMVVKGRGWEQLKTHCPRGHEYSPANTLARPGEGWRGKRRCRECERIRGRLRYARSRGRA